MSTRRPPDHGTEARYKGCASRPPCRCPRCTRQAVRGVEIRKLDQLAGNPRKIPAGPVIAHLAVLRGADMSWGQIAHAAGTSTSTPREIYVEQFETVLRSTAEKLLSVRPHQRPAVGFMSALGATRRLRALYALAHSHRDLFAHIGIGHDCLELLVSGRQTTVSVEVDAAIRLTYDALSMKVGRSRRTRARAQREGWAPPLAWDDIDNPDAQPVVPEVPHLDGREARRALAEARAEDIAYLARFGVPVEDIAERVGLTVGYVRDQLEGLRKPGWRDEKASA